MGASDFITKDSGERAQFESGMQRDTEAGKPRFDLMLPLDVPYDEQMITRLAALYGRGAVKYDDRNWEQADSAEEMARMKSSAFRHFMQWIAGEADEDHAAGTMFNIIAFETTAYKVGSEDPVHVPSSGSAKTAGNLLWEAVKKASAPPEPNGSDCQEIVETKTVEEWLTERRLVALDPLVAAVKVTHRFFENDVMPELRIRDMTSLEVARANGRPY